MTFCSYRFLKLKIKTPLSSINVKSVEDQKDDRRTIGQLPGHYWTPSWGAPRADRDGHHKAHSLPLEKYCLCNHRIDSHNGVLYIINQTTKVTVSNYKNLKADSPTQNMLSQKNEQQLLKNTVAFASYGKTQTNYLANPILYTYESHVLWNCDRIIALSPHTTSCVPTTKTKMYERSSLTQ